MNYSQTSQNQCTNVSPPEENMSVATGPSLKGTNSFQQQGGGGDPQSQATAKGENAAVTFQKDLGKVTNLDGLCKAVGGVLDATTDEDNGTISGKLSANLRLPIPGTGAGYVELRTELAVSGSASALKGPTLPIGSDGKSKGLTVGFSAEIVAGVDLKLFKLEVGVKFGQSMEATGDSGYELVRMAMLAMLPTVEATSKDLAGWMYGNTKDFRKSVSDQMDPKQIADKDGKLVDNPEADSFAVVSDIGVTGGVQTGMDGMKVGVGGTISNRDRTTNYSDGQGGLIPEHKSGIASEFTLEVGGSKWTVSTDNTTNSLELSAQYSTKMTLDATKAIVGLMLEGFAGALRLAAEGLGGENAAKMEGIIKGMMRDKAMIIAATGRYTQSPEITAVLKVKAGIKDGTLNHFSISVAGKTGKRFGSRNAGLWSDLELEVGRAIFAYDGGT